MTFWQSVEARPQQQKLEYVRMTDLVTFLDKEKDLSPREHKSLRFMGPFFGINTITIPLLKEGRFVKKKETNRLIAFPKVSLGFNYLSNTLDESKCPYLQHVNEHNKELLSATIHYVEESTLKDKEVLLACLRTRGLRSAWEDKAAKEVLKSSKELFEHLRPVMTKGNKEFYTNVFLYPITPTMNNLYTDMGRRSPEEQTPVDFLDYTATYGDKVFLKDNKTSPADTPAKVLKLTSYQLEGFYKDIVKLNTITDPQTGMDIVKGIEDPLYGSKVTVRLEMTPLKTAAGLATYKYMFGKSDRQPLSESEKKYLLWDLRVLQGTETYAQAEAFLANIGYLKNAPVNISTFASATQSLDFAAIASPINVNVAPQVVNQPVAPVMQVSVATPVTPVVQAAPVTQTTPVKPLEDFDAIFAN